jgi:hypothetical protein
LAKILGELPSIQKVSSKKFLRRSLKISPNFQLQKSEKSVAQPRIRNIQLPEGRGARGAASLRFFYENLVRWDCWDCWAEFDGLTRGL